MKHSLDVSKRAMVKNMGALAGATALSALLPTAVTASSDTAVQNSTEPPTPELERYGIRGYRAPEIILDYWIDANGKPTEFSVMEQRGKWLFMKFFQSWCPGCHKFGFPTLQKFTDAFGDHPDVEAVAVQTVFEGATVNTKEKVREIQLRYDLPITMGHDVGSELTEFHPLSMINYRTGGTPWLILVAPDGTVVQNTFHMDSDYLIEFLKQHVA